MRDISRWATTLGPATPKAAAADPCGQSSPISPGMGLLAYPGDIPMVLTVCCLRCGTEFTYARAGRSRKYCSRSCSRAHTRGPRTVYPMVCTRCNQAFNGRLDQPSKFCSYACMNSHARARKAPAIYTGPPFAPPVRSVRTTNRLTSGRCAVCTAWFVSLHSDTTCSPECRKQRRADRWHDKGHRRRARKYNGHAEPVNRKTVFERDGYRCHLCRKLTNPAKPVPHPRAPTIDHIVPLAKGGTHQPTNCRTACFSCNTAKGDRGGGEQLLLIA